MYFDFSKEEIDLIQNLVDKNTEETDYLRDKIKNQINAIGRKIYLVWDIEDVIFQAKSKKIDLTEEEAEAILSEVNRKHDCTIGVNWDVIESYIDMRNW